MATRAKSLQTAHTARRDILIEIKRRLSSVRFRNKPETWLFPGLKSKRERTAEAPTRLDAEKKRAWARQRYDLDLALRHEAITARIKPGGSLLASFKDGELSVSIDGVPVIERIFVDATEGEFIGAQWKVLCSTFAITENTDGRKLANALRRLALPDNPALVQQIIEREGKLSALEVDIDRQEAEMDALVSRLYGLTDAESQLIAKG